MAGDEAFQRYLLFYHVKQELGGEGVQGQRGVDHAGVIHCRIHRL